MKELFEVSGYVPDSGYALDLMKLVDAGLERQAAIKHWVAKGRTEESFYKAYKYLKDELIRLAFLEKKGQGTEAKKIEVLGKYKVIDQLLVSGRKKAAVSLSVELLSKAQKLGMTEVVLGLSSLLECHFGSIELDARRYLRYRKIRKDFQLILNEELNVKALQARLVFNIKRKKDLSELEGELKELTCKRLGSYTFLRYRFSVLSIWYELLGNADGLIVSLRETLEGYEKSGVEIPVESLSNLYYRLTPVLVRGGKFAEAEAHISKALQTWLPGTQNWHLFMLQRACLGLVSGKSGMAQSCLKKALDAPREHANPDIERRWSVVKSILDGERVGDVWKAVFF